MEFDLIADIRSRAASSPFVDLGIGDDAALLSSLLLEGGKQLVVTKDIVMDGTDFLIEECGYRAAGRKALAVNLSDMAAMGAEPVAAFVGLVLPKVASQREALELMSGIEELAREFKTVIAGGDTNSWDGKLAVSVTLLGRVAKGRAMTRSGAQVGDIVCVTGALGGSILGHHLTFTPRVKEASWLASHYAIHAMMDLSDGLSSDIQHLIHESKVGTILDATQIPVTDDAKTLSQTSGRSVVDHALHDGEDFELLFTLTPEEYRRLAADDSKPCQVYAIGEVTDDRESRIRREDGEIETLVVGGYRHSLGE
ncbi:thiamine-phosphate kinase [Lacunimicrobium album]